MTGPGGDSAPRDLPMAFRAMLSGAIDYAGLYPPAALSMREAVREYDDCRRGADSWALGRFVVAAARLEELAEVAEPIWRRDTTQRWRLAALGGRDATRDVACIAAHNERFAAPAVVDTFEARAADALEVRRIAALAPANVRVLAEFPHDADFITLARAAHAAGAGGKLRTGGVTRDAFPGADTVARFLVACREAGIPCKVTAGLHHPLRGEYALTDAPDSVRGTMFGYVNVLLAAALAWTREPVSQIVALLEERDRRAFDFAGDGVGWRGTRITPEAIAASRAACLHGFGSCSIREPVGEGSALVQAP